MAAPVVESTTTDYSQTTGSGNIGVTMPAVRPDDDLYLAVIGFDHPDFIITDLQGFTALINVGVANIGGISAVVHRYGSTEPADYTLDRAAGTEKGNVALLRISGIHASSPIGAT